MSIPPSYNYIFSQDQSIMASTRHKQGRQQSNMADTRHHLLLLLVQDTVNADTSRPETSSLNCFSSQGRTKGTVSCFCSQDTVKQTQDITPWFSSTRHSQADTRHHPLFLQYRAQSRQTRGIVPCCSS